MIGSLNQSDRRVTVVGAGISGLLLADRLDELGYEVTLLEEASRSGGLIETRRTPYGMAETAAHSLLATRAVREHFSRLGVECAEVNPSSRARFILRNGKARKFPLHLHEAIGAFSRAYLVLSKSDEKSSEQTLEEWTKRHLGRAALDYLVSPFLTGIYAADPSEISVGAAFPSWSVPRGHSLLSFLVARKVTRRGRYRTNSEAEPHPRMVVPREGMGAWTEALERSLEQRLGSRFKKGVPVESMPESPNVALCVPAFMAARLLSGVDSHASTALESIRYAPLLGVTAFVDRSAFAHEPRGVGMLIPRREGRDALGILYTSSSFEGRVTDPSTFASFTLMFGGSARPDCLEWSNEEISSRVNRELKDLLGAQKAAAHIEISRQPRAIPMYSPGLVRAWDELRQGWAAKPGRILFGNYTGQVSLRGMIETVSRIDRQDPGKSQIPDCCRDRPQSGIQS